VRAAKRSHLLFMILTPIPRERLGKVLDRFTAKLSDSLSRALFRRIRATSPARAVAALDIVAHNLAEKYQGAVLPGYENEGIFRSDLKTQLRHAALGNWGAFRPYHVLRRATALALGVAGLVLLIACANISNLLLVRAEKRRAQVLEEL